MKNWGCTVQLVHKQFKCIHSIRTTRFTTFIVTYTRLKLILSVLCNIRVEYSQPTSELNLEFSTDLKLKICAIITQETTFTLSNCNDFGEES